MKIVFKPYNIKTWTEELYCRVCMATLQVDFSDLKVGFRLVKTQNKVDLYCREYYVLCANCTSPIIVESQNIVGKENKLPLMLKRFVDDRKHSCKPIDY